MIKIGPSGNSQSFYAEGHKHTKEAAAWLQARGLTAFEYSFGRGVHMGPETAAAIRQEFDRCGIEISAHAPYYTNFANPDEGMIEKSCEYVRQSVIAENQLGGRRTVFHPASCGKVTRGEAVAATKRNIVRLLEYVADLAFDFILCPETLGKLNQIGTAEEIVEICTLDEKLYPCFDFGHINSYTRGGIKGYDDYKRLIDYTADRLGDEKTKNMHVHFSKIMYGEKGELRHLTFADEKYGPRFEGFARLIREYKLTPFIVCESDGTMAEDAMAMRLMLQNTELAEK